MARGRGRQKLLLKALARKNRRVGSGARLHADAVSPACPVSYSTLFEENPMMLFIVDRDGIIRSINRSGARQLGYRPQELRGRSVFAVFHPDDRQRVAERVAEVLKNPRETVLWEFRKIRKDGSMLWVEELARTVTDTSGSTTLLIACEDITARKQAEEIRERLALAVDYAGLGTWYADLVTGSTSWSANAFEIFGFDPAAGEPSFAAGENLIHPDDRDRVLAATEMACRRRDLAHVEYRIRRADNGHVRWISAYERFAYTNEGMPVRSVGVFFDVTDRRRTMELSDALNRINTVIHSTLDFTMITQQVIVEAAKALEVEAAVIGLFRDAAFIIENIYNLPEEMVGRTVPAAAVKGVHYAAAIRDVVAFNDAAKDERLNLDMIHPRGIRSLMIAPFVVKEEVFGAMAFYFTSAPFRFTECDLDFARKLSASLGLALANARLYDDRLHMEEKMRHMAHHDALTGLSNRRLFMKFARQELAQARRNSRKAGILFLDLDRFKEINDTLGHEAGDDLLREVAVRLGGMIRESDTISRIGGDEFNVLLADLTSVGDISVIVRKIMACFRDSFTIGGHELHITPSIGISVFPDDGDDVGALLRYADIALYYAKEHGRNNYQFYNEAINRQSIERIKLEGRLRQTLERGELTVFYQPQIDIRSRRIVCAEALVRWRHPERGLLEPMQFIPAAEDTGFITAIDEYVMRTACTQFRSWQDAGLSPVCFTVNLSAREFQNPELAAKIRQILEETGACADCLDVEITETVAMNNVDRTVTRLKELAAMGVHTSIDDFGTGYSSLNYLKRLPIEKLKIDQSFIRDIATDADDRAIIGAVTAMAHHMKMKVIAEGVETEDQLSFLREIHCDEAQGFLFSRPVPAEEFRLLIRGSSRAKKRLS